MLVGEVVAETSDGLTWTEVATVGYRANGKFDSCWYPLIKMTMTPQVGDAAGTANPWSATPEDLGRCLPFWYRNTEVNQYYLTGDPGYVDGQYNFFVEHNLGPVKSITDIDVKVYAAFGPQPSGANDGTNYLVSATGNWQGHHQISTSSASLWNGYNFPYSQYHEYSSNVIDGGNEWLRGTRGFVKEVKDASLAHLDPRWARISIPSEFYLTLPQNEDKAQYIRVIIQRVR